DVPGGSRPYFGVEKHHMGEEEHFRTWHGGSRVTTGAVRLTEYNFKTPHAAQEVSQEGTIAHDHSKVESFDWPGDYLQQGQGTGVVARRVEEETGGFARHHATGDVASLAAGTCVTLSGDDVPGASGQRFVCLQAVHEFRSQSYGSGESQNTDRAYDGTYVLMPDTEPLRPQRTTPRPIIHGPQTAVVVGDGEIDCDEYGRILVRFHWDLAGAYSMRCRVSQNWASKGWGGMVIPRIGMEVIVEHLEGDPDKPIVTGCVYNGANMPPYDLPAHKTKSVFRSDTHKGSGFNEFMFEDEKGEEKIYLHAEKDHEIHVENNRAKRVDRNQSESVGNNKSIEIGNNHHEVIGGNMTVMVGPNKLQTAVTSAFSKFTDRIGGLADKLGLPDIMNMGEGNLIIGVGKNKAETVMISSNEIVGAAKTVTVGGGYQLSVQGIRNESTLLGAYEEVGQNKVVVAGKRIEFSTGKSMIQLNEDGSILIEGVTVTVKGSSRIDLN
ncbi:MAG: type VI secretion system tip protein TssI/VgrG, partial [Pseudomonadota bacterium]